MNFLRIILVAILASGSHAKHEPSLEEVQSNPFFQKFFEEFQKQYMQLQEQEMATKQHEINLDPYYIPKNPFLDHEASTTKPDINNRNQFLEPEATLKPHTNHKNPFLESQQPSRPHVNTRPFIGPQSSTPEPHINSQNPFLEPRPSTRRPASHINSHKQFLEPKPSTRRPEPHINSQNPFLESRPSTRRPHVKIPAQSSTTTKPRRRRPTVHINHNNPFISSPSTTETPEKINKSKLYTSENFLVPRNLQVDSTTEIPTTPLVSTKTPNARKTSRINEEEFRKQAESAKYEFASDVHDDINGGEQLRQETRVGNFVMGQYSYNDGFYHRTVHYEADDKGFRVIKEDVEEIGNGPKYNPKGKAEVKSVIEGNVVNFEITNNDVPQRRRNNFRRVTEDKEETSEEK